jgi:predicted nucleotidyltransferase
LIVKLKGKLAGLAMELPLRLVVLFGSYAQGTNTVASDIDILVVYKGEERRDAFGIVKGSLDIPLLEPHVYSEDEYGRLKDRIDRMTADGVTLFS